jgi:hypothetical protein
VLYGYSGAVAHSQMPSLQALAAREAANGVVAFSVDPGFVSTSMADEVKVSFLRSRPF